MHIFELLKLWFLATWAKQPASNKLWHVFNTHQSDVSINQEADVGTGPFQVIWEFPKIRGALFWGPYNKDPTI